MGDSELKPLYLSPFVNNSGYQGIRRERERERERAVNSLSSALYLWVIYFLVGGGGGGICFLFTISTKRGLLKTTPK